MARVDKGLRTVGAEVKIDTSSRYSRFTWRAWWSGLSGAQGQVDALLSDAATIISVALQYGVPPAAFRKSVGRSPNLATVAGSSDQLMAGNHAASPIGAAVDLLCSFEQKSE